MKQILITLTALSLFSCEKDENKASIVGKWSEIKTEVISGKDSKTILETRIPTSCEAQGFLEIKSDNTLHIETFESEDNDCVSGGFFESDYSYDSSSEIFTVEESQKKLSHLTESTFKITYKGEDSNDDGFPETNVVYYKKR